MGRMTQEIKALYASTAAIAQSYIRWGRNIYEDEWDLLIILDACRVDALEEVQEDYDFINGIRRQWSRGSTSKEWLENTFVEAYRDDIESTAYVTPNPFSSHLKNSEGRRVAYTWTEGTWLENNEFVSSLVKDDLVIADDFGEFIGLWEFRDEGEISQLHPEKVTDCAIRVGRQTNCDRQIVHFMQPHRPYLTTDNDVPWKERPFGYIIEGGNFDDVWTSYVDNLRFVLDHVETLLENLDAETVVITSDHGELFGEWGLYSHEVGIPHSALRKVPWTETSASDTGNYRPEPVRSGNKASDKAIQERLEALGYR